MNRPRNNPPKRKPMARPKANPDVHGILVVDKPGLAETQSPDERLLTSHDVVQRVRRWGKQRRIGHTGTLDPFASGVLVLCLGQATRLVEYYQGHDKTYWAEVKLGSATDTYDVTGTVTTQASVPTLDHAMLEAALAQFRGKIQQTPPIYSALKRDGEALYAKARRGEAVEIEARPVTIHALTLVDWQPPDTLVLRVHCSAGTYIRTLAHDLGAALGTAAHLTGLRREAAGAFTLDDAHPLDEVAAAAEEGRFDDLLLPLGTGLTMPQVTVETETAQRLGYGQVTPLSEQTDDTAADRLAVDLAVAQDATGIFLGIIRCVDATASPPLWKAEKWLAGT